jgi:hypothetical protein
LFPLEKAPREVGDDDFDLEARQLLVLAAAAIEHLP